MALITSACNDPELFTLLKCLLVFAVYTALCECEFSSLACLYVSIFVVCFLFVYKLHVLEL